MLYAHLPTPLGDCIDAVYQAARQVEDWGSVLALFHRTFPGTKWALASEEPGARRNVGFIWHGFEDGLIRDYVAHYAHINPWVPYAARFPTLKAAASDDYLPSYLFKNHEFYAGFIEAAQEAESAAGIKLFQNTKSFAILSVHYGSRMAETYNQSLPRFLDALAPHLKNAVEINTQLHETRQSPRMLTAMIEQFAEATFLLDHRGRVHATNPASEALLDAKSFATRDREGRLRPTRPSAARRLDLLLSSTSRTPIAELPTPIATSDHWRFIEASSGDRSVSHAWLPSGGRWVLALFGPAQAPENIDATIAEKYTLTPRQMEIARALVDGYSLSETADRLGLSMNTVRQHLKAIFTKTSTHRQAELVTRLNMIGRAH